MPGMNAMTRLMMKVITNVLDMYRLHDMDGDGKAGKKIADLRQVILDQWR